MKGAVKTNEDTEMLQRFPLRNAAEVVGYGKRDNRHGGRITCSIQLTLIPSLISLHTPTTRTLHIAQIHRVIQKQLVCLRAVSSSTGAFRF